MTVPREHTLSALAHRLWQAERRGTVTARLTSSLPDLTLEEAYAVRREVDQLRMATGAIPVGRKIGLSSRELLARAGVAEPAWAYIFDRGRVPNGTTLNLGRYFRLSVETEVALVLGTDLPERPISRERAAAAVRAVHPAFELADMRTDVEGMNVVESIADSGWHAGYVLGDGVPAAGIDLDAISVRVSSTRSDVPDTVGRSDMLLDGPLGCLTWLAGRAIADDAPLRTGEVILTGSLAGVIPLNANETLTAEFTGIGPGPLVIRLSGN